ncbi:MAG: hypothetical protein ACRC9P_05790 [Bacteroides sp.]
MNSKFKSVLLAGAALFTLAACSNDDSGITSEVGAEAQMSDLELIVHAPNSTLTRGVLESTVSETKASVDGVVAYLIEGDRAISTAEAKKNDDNYTLLMKNVPVKEGSTKLVVVGYNKDEHKKEDLNISIKDVQPTEEAAGIKNSAYVISVPLKETENTNGSSVKVGTSGNKTLYTVEAEMRSITARVEMSGQIKFNEDLVKESYVSHVIPMSYRNSYQGGHTINEVGVDLADNSLDGSNPLALKIDAAEDWEAKVVANHIFDGDKQLFNLALSSTLYDCVMEGKDNSTYTLVAIDSEGKELSAIYKDEDGKLYAKNTDGLYCDVKKEEVGEAISYIPTQDFSISAEDLNLKTKFDVRWFTIGDFSRSEGKELGQRGYYVGGHIYKLDFEKGLTWKGEKADEFSPDADKGSSKPQVTQVVDVLATVKVADWTEANYTAEMN